MTKRFLAGVSLLIFAAPALAQSVDDEVLLLPASTPVGDVVTAKGVQVRAVSYTHLTLPTILLV